MKCPQCGHGTVVKDGRYLPEGYWRRRQCTQCKTELTSLEQVCETARERPLPGTGRRKQMLYPKPYKAPPPPKVTVKKASQASAKPVVPKQKTAPVQKKVAKREEPAWVRIQEQKEQRELQRQLDAE